MTSQNELMEQANRSHLAGRLTESRQLYDQVLAADPAHAQANFRLGVVELGESRPDAALTRFEKAIAADPAEFRFHFGLGRALCDLGRFPQAIEAYQRVLSALPQSADVHFALGFAYESSGFADRAAAAYESAISFDPSLAEAHCNLGKCLQLLANKSAAENAFRRALALRPDFPVAMGNLGTLLAGTEKHDEALALLRRAAELEPQSAVHRLNLGSALCAGGDFAEALFPLQQAAQMNPALAEAHYNLGRAHQGLGRTREAIGAYQRALALDPRHASALINLGTLHQETGEYREAEAAFLRAAEIAPRSPVPLNNAGCLYRLLGKIEQAAEMLRRAIALDPQLAASQNNLGDVHKDSGDLDPAIECYRQAVALDPSNAISHSNLAYSLHFQSLEGEEIKAECIRWNTRHGNFPDLPVADFQNDRSPERRLRIGYVSGDFRNHCQSFFTIPLLSTHDKQAAEVFCYSNVERPDAVTQRIIGYADHWRDVRTISDAQLCTLIREDRIDILVDLALHMAHGRPGVFARRAAPLQVAWLAYPGTTGIATMDFAISDPHLTPPELDHHYTERVLRLPETFWCYDPLTAGPEVGALPALAAGRITFGCLNAPCKISDRAIAMWAGAMKRVSNSRLILMAPAGTARDRLYELFRQAGIDPERISFVPFQSRMNYLQTYQAIDIALDPFPYNGHTTSLDAFWMGVPVPTRVGNTAAGRGGLSQLTNLGLPALAASSDEAYIEIVANLAADLPALAALRTDLRHRMQQSPLMDNSRFARNMESAFRTVWREFCTAHPASAS